MTTSSQSPTSLSFNTTKREQSINAAKDLALKLRQENKLDTVLRPHFNSLSRQFAKTYAATGQVMPVDQHRQDINNILNGHYQQTGNIFATRMRDELGQTDNDELVNSLVDININNYSSQRSAQSAAIIANTSHKDMHNAVRNTIIAAALVGKVLSNRQIARKAKQKFSRDAAGRVPTISVTDTQSAAEGAKDIEFNTLASVGSEFNGRKIPKKKNKTWRTIFDNVTRHAHVLADDQTVDAIRPYTVDSEKLQYPGDTSLGASPGNVINCRCSSQISFS